MVILSKFLILTLTLSDDISDISNGICDKISKILKDETYILNFTKIFIFLFSDPKNPIFLKFFGQNNEKNLSIFALTLFHSLSVIFEIIKNMPCTNIALKKPKGQKRTKRCRRG